MSLTYLKSFFLGLCFICLLTLTYYIVLPTHRELEFKNSLYFYEYEPRHRQNFSFILREKLKCEDINPFLVILVCSRPTDVKARQAIRIAWGSQKLWWGNQVLTLFLVGKGTAKDDNFALSIEDESILYGDIIQQDFADTYSNLTLKTIMGFRWVTEFCPNARYVMKTDSDVFINPGNLVKFLLNSNASENFYTGYPLVDNFSYRRFYHKTSISFDMYPFKVYPPYCSGFGYILDTRLAQRVYEIMNHVKPIRLEDVYVGICLNILNVGISFPEDQELFFLYRIHFDVCKYKHLIAVHGISPQEIIAFWQEITKEMSLSCH